MTSRDRQRSAVYSAETLFANMLDFADRNGSTAQIAGTSVTLPVQARFASVDSIQAYVDRVGRRPTVLAQFGPARAVRVRARKGTTAAHYEHDGAVIAVPMHLGSHLAREHVLVHELAHHFAGVGVGHGPTFTATMLWLLNDLMGPEAAFVLQVLYSQNDVQIGEPATS